MREYATATADKRVKDQEQRDGDERGIVTRAVMITVVLMAHPTQPGRPYSNIEQPWNGVYPWTPYTRGLRIKFSAAYRSVTQNGLIWKEGPPLPPL